MQPVVGTPEPTIHLILYIGLPVLAEFSPAEIVGDLALYNIILRLLHHYWHNDKKLNGSISFSIKIYIENLSNARNLVSSIV